MLQIVDLHAGYGLSQVLSGVSLELAAGQTLALLGRNGSGRTTLLKAMMGMLPSRGEISWCGRQLQGCKTFEIARMGVGYVPESRDVFANLSVTENLLLGQRIGQGSGRWVIDDIFVLFPQLASRSGLRAGALSGGEQQMLSLGRTLLGDPELILIDEPMEGLAPQLVQVVCAFLLALKARGITVVLIEQKLDVALQLADRCAILGAGRIIFEGVPATLRQRDDLLSQWLQV